MRSNAPSRSDFVVSATSPASPVLPSPFPHLDSAPIVEALIQFGYGGDAELSLEQVREIADELRGDGYEETDLRRVSGTLTLSASSADLIAETTPAVTVGFRQSSPDGSWLSQIMITGLSVHHVGNYPGWEVLADKATDALSSAIRCMPELRISTVACRFLNHIVLSTQDDPSNYLRTIPFIPGSRPTAPLAIEGLLSNLQLSDVKSGASASVTQHLLNLEDASLTFLIDIESRLQTEDHLTLDDTLPAALDAVRFLKNRIFFGSITPDLAERFSPNQRTS